VLSIPQRGSCDFKDALSFIPYSQFVEVGGHLVDLRVVMILDLLQEAGVTGQHEVDGRSLSAETTSTADSMDVVLLLLGQLEVDNESDLLDIDTTGEHISGDEDTDGSRSELLHHDFTLLLVHLSVHAGDDEVLAGHAAFELVDSALSVTVDDGLVDVQVGVEVQKNVHLPLLLLDSDVVLVDTLEGEVLLLDEDLCGVPHEMLGQSQNIGRQRGREQANLNVSGQELEDVLDLTLEATGEHLVSLVQDEQLEVVSLEETSLHHVVHAAGCSDDDVLALLEDTDVLTHDRASNASVHLDTKVLADRVHHEGGLHHELTDGSNDQGLRVVASGVDALQRSNSERTSLSSSGLRLCNGVFRLDDWQDSLLLDG